MQREMRGLFPWPAKTVMLFIVMLIAVALLGAPSVQGELIDQPAPVVSRSSNVLEKAIP